MKAWFLFEVGPCAGQNRGLAGLNLAQVLSDISFNFFFESKLAQIPPPKKIRDPATRKDKCARERKSGIQLSGAAAVRTFTAVGSSCPLAVLQQSIFPQKERFSVLAAGRC